ncbi:hypothetical protein VTJ83DRAFT_6733 [Remersonia thermophila]|uniref:Genetic interactor of prohibitins 3, mitochondrial n=1 Tax=Remersonia thermophila TaxID=72144 RepID=A0ABR4D5M0_9PEZI
MPPNSTLSSRWIGRVFNLERTAATSELPLYLCPAFRSLPSTPATLRRRRRPLSAPAPPLRSVPVRRLHAGAAPAASAEPPAPTEPAESSAEPAEPAEPQPKTKPPARALPLQCHGCGALSQTKVPGEAGYYDLSRKAIRLYLGLEEEAPRRKKPSVDHIVQQALQSVDVAALQQQGINLKTLLPEPAEPTPKPAEPSADKPPLCDRCHHLIHHSAGSSIYHPSVESLRDTILETPYKHNHVYHVLDAADFPMSLLPRLHSLLDITLRTQNRRAKNVKFHHGRLMEMSFIISRSDLLAPRKEQVDSLMPYLQNTLREALGRVGGRVRLGNVHCVSAKRGWWTKELKEQIWKRGGAGWMVGKANVGKSQLFEAVFPKGRRTWEAPKHHISVDVFARGGLNDELALADTVATNALLEGRTLADEFSLLPPPLPETDYPPMPVVSSLPGTTASPIRVPFGDGRGELIDLPGLARSDLELHVREDKRGELIMKARVTPEQHVIKPGQSLLLGGLIRITPRNVAPDEELVFLAYAFTPIEPHLTSTDKAVAIQTQAPDAPNVETIARPGTGDKIRHAGAYQLRYDVTKARSGPLTRREAVGLKVERLPYRVLGIDILIEGCGWVELAVQVRTRQLYPDDPKRLAESGPGAAPPPTLDLRPEPVNAAGPSGKRQKGEHDGYEDGDALGDAEAPEPRWPVVDVYSPDGGFVGYRPPMNAWLLNKPKPVERGRPRKSMKGVKKMEKKMRRERERLASLAAQQGQQQQ